MFRAYLPTLFPLFSPNFFFPKKKEKSFPFQSGLDSIRLLCLFSVFYFLFSQTAYSQDTIKRPKIGVVLSGGGAKGFAHIGVLKVLEEAGVKIDYIGGTSMGAVVGGLYATGYSATQIDSIFKATNFDELLQDYIPRTSKNFYEKQNDERYAVSLPFRKFSLGVPIALSKGMYNYNLLAKLTHKVRHVRDFNQLSIPFVCIATDIESGKEVIMHSGYLAQAMLASSAFPTLFSPVEIDGRLLIDGGVSNNYPVEEIRKMGADIIIGVDVQDDLKDRNALNDATRILVQISNLQMIESMKDKILKTDMYIKPDISKFTVISFDQGEEIIKRGEEAAFACYEKIKSYGSEKYQLSQVKTKVDTLNINKIIVNDLKNYTASYVIGTLGFKQNSTISYDDLKKGINTLNATQNFSTISYTIEKNENGGDDLLIDLGEIKTKSFLKFGLHYDGLYKSAVLVNLTLKKSLFRNDVLSVDVALGDNFRYDFDYYVDNGFYFSFGLKSRYNQFNRNISTDFNNGSILNQYSINKLNIDFSDLTNQAYLQTLFFQKFLIGGGLEWKHISIESRTLTDRKTVFENSDYLSLFGSVKYDSFDNKYFPKKGWFFNGDIHTYLYSSDFTNQFNRFSIMKGEVGITRTFYKRFNVKFTSEAGFSFGESSVHFLDFVLGGYGFSTVNNFRHFYGYDFISLAGDSYIKSAATVDVEFYKKNHLNFSANFANVENKLFSTGNWLSTPMYSGYAIGYGLETVVGPVELKYSWSPELPKGFTWISVGFWF